MSTSGTSPLRHPHLAPTLSARGWTLMGIGILFVAVAAVVERREPLFVGVFLIAVPVAAMAILAGTRPRLVVSRSLPPGGVAADTPVTVTVTIETTTRPVSDATWGRDDAPAGAGAPQAVPVPPLSRGVAQTVRYVLPGLPRGRHWIGPWRIERRDPFGMARVTETAGDRRLVEVTPTVTVLADRIPSPSGADGSSSVKARRGQTQITGLAAREYRTGDPLKHVHWKTTARVGELMVRQEEPRSARGAWILLDDANPDSVAAPAAEATAAFERAVQMAASAVIHMHGAGYQWELVGYSATDTHSMLRELAGLSRGGHAHPRISAVPRGGPAIAVLVAAEFDTVSLVLERGSLGDPRIAFVTPIVSDGARARLAAAGWQVIDLAADATADAGSNAVAAAWDQVKATGETDEYADPHSN